MFFACGIWCLAGVLSVRASEHTGVTWVCLIFGIIKRTDFRNLKFGWVFSCLY